MHTSRNSDFTIIVDSVAATLGQYRRHVADAIYCRDATDFPHPFISCHRPPFVTP